MRGFRDVDVCKRPAKWTRANNPNNFNQACKQAEGGTRAKVRKYRKLRVPFVGTTPYVKTIVPID